MSNKTEVEQATDIIDKMLHSFTSGAIACALSAAGLLRTDADRRCVEACIAAHCTPAGEKLTGPAALRRWYECCDAGRAILDARKPVERWTVAVSDASGALFVLLDGTPANKSFPRDAEPEARAYVARKNAEEAERAK